jgi:dipeptidyl-peptidase-4
MRIVILVCAFLAVPTWSTAQPKSDPSKLTLERIFSSNEFAGDTVPAIRWRKSGGYVTIETVKGAQQLVTHDPATGKSETLVPDHWLIPAGETKALPIEGYEFSRDQSKMLIYSNSKRVWRANSRGDYWLLDLSTRELKKLGGDAAPSMMQFATFSPDGKKIGYVYKNNLFVQDLRGLSVTALTTNGSDTLINGTFDWVYEEELHIRNGFRWSPDSKSIAYWQLDSSGVKEFHITNSSDGPYPKVITIRYPKTGEQNSSARIGVVSAEGGETSWLAFPGDPREHYLAKMEWAGNEVVVQQFNRLQNTNVVMATNPESPKPRIVLVEKDNAWVENNNEFRWIDGGKQLVWLSERDGWRHIFLAPRNGDKLAPVTSGKFDVISIEAIDEKNGHVYFLASPDNPTQRYLYRTSLKGGNVERVTPGDSLGTHSYSISPDAKYAVHSFSTFTQPAVTSIIHLPDHKVVKMLGENAALKKKLAALRLGATEFFRVNIDGGVQLDGWCIKPPNFDASKKYPVLFYIYGEPAGQTVLDRFDGRRFLWHSFLAQQGYIVMSVDNRGTPAPRGRDWRKIIYRQIGILAPADQAAAVRTLQRERSYMDSTRIAIWGWSGGGSMTLNAMFRYPDLYQTGIAVAPVPNQRHYDTIYQERYMGLPADNVEGYRKGSPIHFAKELKGNLLIVHGTGDDNVHYHGVETLIDELITHNKQFSMLAYPNRSHSINEGRGTTRHLYESMWRYLRTNTPP